jgi:hypothetical protein
VRNTLLGNQGELRLNIYSVNRRPGLQEMLKYHLALCLRVDAGAGGKKQGHSVWCIGFSLLSNTSALPRDSSFSVLACVKDKLKPVTRSMSFTSYHMTYFSSITNKIF